MSARYRRFVVRASVVGLALAPRVALASTAGAASPWDAPLVTIKNDLTGPVAGAIAAIVFFAAFYRMAWHADEMGPVARGLTISSMAVAGMVGAAAVLTWLNIAGALVS